MSEEPLDILTDWVTGTYILVNLELHGINVQNKGIVLVYKPQQLLSYTHLSSLSDLPDLPDNYAVLNFSLETVPEGTKLHLLISNFATEVIYNHLKFYWNITLELFRKKIEERGEA